MREKCAFVIVDVQNDFLPGGALGVHRGDDVVPVINRALDLPFDLIVASRDFHPPHHISFASTWEKKPGESIMLPQGFQILWPDHCVQGTFGCDFSKDFDTSKVHHIISKGSDPAVDSYSIFFDKKKGTGTEELLHKKGITKVYIAGLATDYCVLYSVRDAIKLGFSVVVILDGCRGVDLKTGDVERALNEMKKLGATLISEKELHESFKK